MIHLLGKGTAPNNPKNGNVGVIGKYGTRKSFASGSN
jgi:hypothetical protein